MSPLLKNLFIILALVVVCGGAYYLIQQGAPTELVSSTNAEEITRETEKIIENINRIKQYELDESVFTDKRFTSLQETRVDLPEVKSGRSNPFAPLQ